MIYTSPSTPRWIIWSARTRSPGRTVPHAGGAPVSGRQGRQRLAGVRGAGLPTRALGFIAGRTGAMFASLLADTGVEYTLR